MIYKKSEVLDKWTADKIGCDVSKQNLREAMDEYTEKKLWDTLSYAVENSSFYRQRYGDLHIKLKNDFERIDGKFRGLRCDRDFRLDVGTFAEFPFTTPDDLREKEMELLCVKPGEISRIVTLDTGGSTGKPKRIYFTEEDQQLTVDFFENGMQLMADETDKVLILMPTRVPGSVGKLLSQGIGNFGAQTIEYGLPDMKLSDSEETEKLLELIKKEKVTGIVALPTHMEMLAEAIQENNACSRVPANNIEKCSRLRDCFESGFRRAEDGNESCLTDDSGYERITSINWVLLSAEYVSEEQAEKIADAFGCKVYEHYGMTEMGLGCAVSCGHGLGYHVREADLYIEIIDPDTGKHVTDGQTGEIVFTTLTRKGMPFIRYRTGDYSRWLTETCSCGSVLKRLDKVEPRNVVKGYLR